MKGLKRSLITEWATAEQALVEQFRPRYRTLVQRVAEPLRRRFESGEFRGWLDEDDERMDSVRGGRSGRYDPRYQAPLLRLEAEVARRLFGVPEQELGDLESAPARRLAALVLLVSVNAAGEFVSSDTPEWQAAEAMALDVLEYARELGWSKPKSGELPRPTRRAA